MEQSTSNRAVKTNKVKVADNNVKEKLDNAVKATNKKATAKKTTAKKSTAKKTTAKKTTAGKKSTAKKTTAKKPTTKKVTKKVATKEPKEKKEAFSKKVVRALDKTGVSVKSGFKKTVKGVKAAPKKIASLSKRAKIIISVVLAIVVIAGSIAGVMVAIRNVNLQSYNLLSSGYNDYEVSNLSQVLEGINDIDPMELERKEILVAIYEAFDDSYNYYLNGLKDIKSPNSRLRESLNEKIEEYNGFLYTTNSEYLILQEQIDTDPADVDAVESYYNNFASAILDQFDHSVELLPLLENYVDSYSTFEEVSELNLALLKVQFNYAIVLLGEYKQNVMAVNQAADLIEISNKYDEFDKTTVNDSLANGFLTAYENYNATDYYLADLKDAFILTLTGDDATYAESFYDFLGQASYN